MSIRVLSVEDACVYLHRPSEEVIKMDSPAGFSDTAMDQDDIPYPCKGCGEVCTMGYLLRATYLTVCYFCATDHAETKSRIWQS